MYATNCQKMSEDNENKHRQVKLRKRPISSKSFEEFKTNMKSKNAKKESLKTNDNTHKKL